jgi:hypothetical protein
MKKMKQTNNSPPGWQHQWFGGCRGAPQSKSEIKCREPAGNKEMNLGNAARTGTCMVFSPTCQRAQLQTRSTILTGEADTKEKEALKSVLVV